ncbi:carbohydrate-binding protein [Oscillibacter sp.]|uniref:carbohydrate-binding protein n=1 Tax=Oscillibacter sp. TaxID=1945593 RepID=UPI00289BC17A|nr:carbohydrate-binding protein [Oscillibacter sp.]
MDSTVNLGLRLPAGTDYADVADLNYNFEQLDAAMAAARSAGGYAETAYAVGDYCTRDGKLYKCTTAITAGEPWNPAHWAETSIDAEFKALYAALAGKAAATHTHTAAQIGADPSGSAAAVQANLNSHTSNKSNPHSITPAQIGADPSGSAAAVQASLNAHAGNTTVHLTAVERTAWNGKANTVTLTCTVPVAWTAVGDVFFQNISVPGMMSGDNPIADILPGGDNAANKLYAEAWGKVLRIDTGDNMVQIWCTEAPTVAFPVQFKVVR